METWYDARAGVLDNDQFRERLQRVDRLAQSADDSRVREASRAMLEASGTESTADGVAAAYALISACEFHLFEVDSI